jgi:hypothetical protein
MDEWKQQDRFADFRVGEADPTGEAGLLVDDHASHADGLQLRVAHTPERLELL